MTFPALFTVGWHTRSDGELSARNELLSVFTPELSDEGESRPVMGWGPAGQSEPDEDRVESGLLLYVPPGWVSGPRDVVDVPGEGRFEQVGWPEGYSSGPFGFSPGGVVRLKRVQGGGGR